MVRGLALAVLIPLWLVVQVLRVVLGVLRFAGRVAAILMAGILFG